MSSTPRSNVAERLRLVLMEARIAYATGERGLGCYWGNHHSQVQRDLRQAPKYLQESERLALYEIWMLQEKVLVPKKTQPDEFPLFLSAYRCVVGKLSCVHDTARPMGLLFYGFDAEHTLSPPPTAWDDNMQRTWVFWEYLCKFDTPDGFFKRLARFQAFAQDDWLCARVAGMLHAIDYQHRCFLPWLTWFWGCVLLLLCRLEYQANIQQAVRQRIPVMVSDPNAHLECLDDCMRAIEKNHLVFA